jgi:hypothetical protein
MKDYILKDFADKRNFNYLYSTEKGFVGYKDKLTKKERALIGAKLIWKRKENKYTADEFAIEFAEWCDNDYFRMGTTNIWSHTTDWEDNLKFTTKELLDKFKKEKGL